MAEMLLNFYHTISMIRLFNISFFIVLFIASFSAYSQVNLQGQVDRKISGQTLRLYHYTDYITYKDTTLAYVSIDSLGQFQTQLSLNQTMLIFCDYGRKIIKFFAENGKSYKVYFPEFERRTLADSLNPYFEPEEYWLGISDTSSDELNHAVIRFLSFYNNLLSNNFYELLQKGYHLNLDTFYNKIDSIFGQIDNPFFQDYITYKLAYLKFMTIKRDMRYITWHYYTHKPIRYQNPAYMDLFNGLFKEFFQYYYNTSNGSEIYNDIAQGKSPYLITKTLKKRYEFQDDTLAELLMLKGLYDGAYPSKLADFSFFPRQQILMTLDSIQMLSPFSEHRKIAHSIAEIIDDDFFKPKLALQDLKLFDFANDEVCISEFKGKYNYLVFCDINNYTCQQNFPSIEKLSEKYQNILYITPIFIKSEKDAVEKYFKQNRFNFPYYFVNSIEDINKQNITIIPRFILIDPYGTIIRNPAYSPTEDFEHHFKVILKNRN